MRILICGAGAMGSLFGAALTRAGHDVWLLSHWTEHVARIRGRGLVVQALDGTTQAVPVAVLTYDDPLPANIEIAFVSVKSRQTAATLYHAAPALAPQGVAVTMQNGVGNSETVARLVGADRAYLGVTSHGATLLGAGRVRHAGQGPTTLASQPDPVIAHQIATLLSGAGFACTVADNIETLVWTKLMTNVGINALTALLNVPNGWLAQNGDAAAVVALAVREAQAVAYAKGIPVPEDAVERALAVAYNTSANISSMLADVRRGVPTEIEVINGAIVREGAKVGVATPINTLLTHLVRAKETKMDYLE